MGVPTKYYELENLLKIEYGRDTWQKAPESHPIMREMKLIMQIASNEPARERRVVKKPRFWTEDRINYLQVNYLNKTDEQLSQTLGTTATAVKNKRIELKLSRLINGMTKVAIPVVYVDDAGRENTFVSRAQLCRYLNINDYQLDKLINEGERCFYA